MALWTLLAVMPFEHVTIAEIVKRAGMTPAAFYYHFSSREELLREVVGQYAEEWAELMEAWLDDANSTGDIVDVASRLLDWASDHRDPSTVFFLTSKGATVSIEDTRLSAFARASEATSAAICRASNSRPSARTRLDGLSFISVLESSLRAELSRDPAFRTLGPTRFRDEVLELCARVIDTKRGAA